MGMTRRGGLLLVAGLLAATAVFAEGVTYTDTMVREAFDAEGGLKAHSVMKRQRERIRKIGDAFLVGDSDSISKNADKIVSDMTVVAETFPSASENTAEVWKAMSGIASEAVEMKKSVELKDHRTAYVHFAKLQGSCIECHQISRGWGKFEELKPEEPAEEAPKAEPKKDPKKSKSNVLVS